MKLRNSVLLVTTVTLLSGCYESEKSCYERLDKDFALGREFSKTKACTETYDELTCSEYALRAVKSQIRISYIHSDDDQDACDYISVGRFLRRK